MLRARGRADPSLPGLYVLDALREPQPDPGVDDNAPVRPPDHRIAVELCNLGEVLREPGEPEDDIRERWGVRRGRAAVAGDEPPRLAGRYECLGIGVRERRDAELSLADQLGEHAAGAEGDERAEHRILDDPGEQLGATAYHRLHEH